MYKLEAASSEASMASIGTDFSRDDRSVMSDGVIELSRSHTHTDGDLVMPHSKRRVVQEVGPGFWNYRGSWKYKGIIEIGSQMSALQLSSGKFLILDCVDLIPEIKAHLDELTHNGTLIEALILTHPFHVSSFPDFIKAYPLVECYGTPRHLRKFPTMANLVGDVNDCKVRGKWLPDVDMRIPAGMEFIRPLPEKDNHMCGMFVYHAASRTVHENDTIMVGYKPNIILKLDGYRHLKMRFQKSITGPGLIPTPESPYIFKDWLLEMMKDWDFDNIAAGHMGNMIGGAKHELQKLILKSEPLFRNLSARFQKMGKISLVVNGKFSLNLETEIFDPNNLECECG